MANDGTVKIGVDVDEKEFVSSLSKLGKTAKGAMNGLDEETERVSSALKDAGENALSFGDILKANIVSDVVVDGIQKITHGLGDFARSSLESGMNFEAQMSRVQAISAATAEDAGRLADKAKEMGESTVFSATESAEALEYMAMAGWKTDDMLNGLAGIMNLAASSGEDLAATSDIVTDALTAFGMTAEDSSHFADVLAVASSNANTNVGMMGETFKYVAPVAGAMGYNIEDVAVAIGLMANSGIKSTQAGTALRGVLTNLAYPSKNVYAAMQNLGISLTDTTGKVKPLALLIDELRDAFSGLSEAEQTESAAAIAGKEAMSGLLAIVNASEADYQKLTDAIADADGTAQEMADTMTDNLSGSLKLMGSAAEGVGIALYEKFTEPLKGAAEGVSRFLSGIKQMLEGTRTLEQFGYLLSSIFQNFILNATGSMGKTVSESWAMVTGMLKEKIVDSVASISQYIQENMPSIISSGLDFLAGLASSIREGTEVMVDAGIQLVTSLAQGLADSFPTIIEKLPGIVSDIAGVINDNAPKLLQAGISLIITLGKGLILAIPTLIKNIPQIILAIVDVITAFNWMNLGKGIIDGLINGIKGMFGSIKVTVQTVVQNIRTVFADLPGYLKAIGKDMINGLWEGIKSMVSWIKDNIAGFIKGIAGSLSGSMRKEAESAAKSSGGGSSRSLSSPASAPFSRMVAPVNESDGNGEDGISLTASTFSRVSAVRALESAIPAAQSRIAAATAAMAPAGGTSYENYPVSRASMAEAFKDAMNGMEVTMDGRTVGRMVTKQQNNIGRAFGTA